MYNNFFNSFLMAFVPYGIVPINELYAWSNNQKIHILFHKIAELIEASNGYDQLFMEVKKLLEDFDDDVIEKVTEVLQEWYDDGKLDEALESIVADYFNQFEEQIENLEEEFNSKLSSNVRTSVIDFERIFRVLKVNGNYMYNQPSYETPADDTRTAHYTMGQGGCRYIDTNGNERIVIVYICNDGTPFQANNNGIIEIYDGVGNLIRSRTFTNSEIGHGQCITYHNGYLYLAGSIYNDSNGVKKIRYIPEDLSGTFQYILLTNFNYVNGIAEYNGHVYLSSAIASEIDIAELQFHSDNITPLPTVINTLSMNPPNLPSASGEIRSDGVYSAGFSVTKDYYYFGLYKPEGILRCKRNFETIDDAVIEVRFTPDWFFNSKKHLDNDMFYIGEPEALTVLDNGDVWSITTQHLNTKGVCMHEITQVFKQNLFTNTNLTVPKTNATGRETVRCDSTDGNTTLNPIGTEEKPFKTIDEAIWWFNNYPHSDYCTFLLRGNHPYTVFCIGKRYRIDGDHTYQTYSGRPTATGTDNKIVKMSMIGNVLAYGSYIEIYNCAVYPTLHYLISGYNDEKLHGFCIEGGTSTIVNSGVAGGNNPNIIGAFHIRNNFMNYTWNNSLSNTVNYSQHSFIHNYANGKKYYFNVGNSTINGHNDVTYKQNGYIYDTDTNQYIVHNVSTNNEINFEETI